MSNLFLNSQDSAMNYDNLNSIKLIDYFENETQPQSFAGGRTVKSLIDMLASETSDQETPAEKEPTTEVDMDEMYKYVKTFFNRLKKDGVDVKVKLNGTRMSEFFDSDDMSGGKKAGSKKPRKKSQYMILQGHVRKGLNSIWEGENKIPAVSGTVVASQIIKDILEKKHGDPKYSITNAEEYFESVTKYITDNKNSINSKIEKDARQRSKSKPKKNH